MEIRISYGGRNVRREKKPCFSLVALIMTLLASGEVIIHSSQWHTAVTKRETAIGLDDLDNEVQIVSEERPGKRRAVERQLLQGKGQRRRGCRCSRRHASTFWLSAARAASSSGSRCGCNRACR